VRPELQLVCSLSPAGLEVYDVLFKSANDLFGYPYNPLQWEILDFFHISVHCRGLVATTGFE
jgi:hypothetical protein